MSDAPKVIYLQWAGKGFDCTWCEDAIGENDLPDVKYVRADELERLTAELVALRQQGELVAWQYRTHEPNLGWSRWEECTKKYYDQIIAGELVCQEGRALIAAKP